MPETRNINALSPLDGRYAGKLAGLSALSGEGALARRRPLEREHPDHRENQTESHAQNVAHTAPPFANLASVYGERESHVRRRGGEGRS